MNGGNSVLYYFFSAVNISYFIWPIALLALSDMDTLSPFKLARLKQFTENHAIMQHLKSLIM